MTPTGLFNLQRKASWPGTKTVNRLLIAATTGLILTSCSSTPESAPTPEQPKTISIAELNEKLRKQEEAALKLKKQQEGPEAVAHGIEEEQEIVTIDDPWELLAQANVALDSEATVLLIRAINEFISRGQHHTAQSVIEKLKTYALTKDQQISAQILQGRAAAASGRHTEALSLLARINHSQIQNLDTQKQVLKTLATSQIALNRKSDAVATLLDLDFLVEDQKQLENQQIILKLLQSMDGLHIAILKENSPSPSLEGWIALTDTLKTTTPQLRQADLNNWRAIYPNHPVQFQLLYQNASLVKLDEYSQIALLLPLTSPYGGAARAFYDGFMQAHSANFSFQPPNIILYDIGEEPYLTSFYYQAAVNEGADFIVGPLGRRAADALLSSRKLEVTTLLIADILPEYVSENLFGISLSPEKEAHQVAEKAFFDGHRQATVFRSDGEWGNRVATAFIDHWELLGGTIVKSSSFPSDVSDYSRVIEKFLGLDRSVARKRLLEAQVDTKLHFSARRNEDMDMLFLAANADQSRLVVPQLRFFQAHDFPIFATSYAYEGNPNPAVDADLDGLVLGDMKWMFDSIALYKTEIAEKLAQKAADEAASLAEETDAIAPTNPETESTDAELFEQISGENNVQVSSEGITEPVTELSSELPAETPLVTLEDLTDQSKSVVNQNPYQKSALNRIYALGLQSYQLTSRLKLLRKNSWDKFQGDAMTVSVAEDGNVIRHPVWAQFRSGLAEPVDPLENADIIIEN